MIVIVIGVAVCLGFQPREGGCDELSEVGHDPLRHLNPQKPSPSVFQTSDLSQHLGNVLHVLDGKLFLAEISGVFAW